MSAEDQAKKPLRVPYGKSVHGQEEIDAIVEVLHHSTQAGEKVRAFEQQVAALFDKAHGIMVNSGSSANFLTFEILDFPKGAEVITPALTFATTVSPLVKQGLVPAFVDVEPGTYNIDIDQAAAMINPKTKAMLIPNLVGNLPDWAQLAKISQAHGIPLIEDSADTIGATFNDQPTGSYSTISTTSFYGSHLINCAGNGGMLCVNDSSLAEQAIQLRSWGRRSSLNQESENIDDRLNVEIDGIPYDSKFVFDLPGYNLEGSELGAAFGLVQLGKLSDFIQRRIDNFEALFSFFQAYEQWFILPRQHPKARTAWLAFPLTLRKEAPFDRKALQIYLEEQHIQTRPILAGNIMRQPGFRSIQHRFTTGGCPVADQVMEGGIMIGCHQGMDQTMIDYLRETFTCFFDRF